MSSTMESQTIASHMQRLLEQYRNLRGQSCGNLAGQTFWHVVVITTADEAQCQAFKQQINDKLKRNELPLDIPIHVVADPPGPSRIGNGGSTLTTLEFLHNMYGERLFNLKVLLIHAGGWSQRMPSATILGKIFAPIPYGEPVYQMLDLKLAMYLSFVPRLSPGVFLVCADDFLVYDLGNSSVDWSFPSQGFTALAHPSPISIGRTHGVYVVDGVENLDTREPVVVARCLEVLQKPSDQRMLERGALLRSLDRRFEFAGGITMEGEVVYTDSSFYFGVDVVRRLLELKENIGDITCEIDAYGDFLQALGPRATDAYIYNTSNISHQTSDLITVRKQVFESIRACDIHLLLLNASKFIHIGTTKELIHHFCADEQFKSQMQLQNDVFNSWLQPRDIKASQQQFVNAQLNDGAQAKNSDRREGCIMHAVLVQSSSISKQSVLEYCHFEVPVVIEEDSIISNCQLLMRERSEENIQSYVVQIPKKTFLHTVSIQYQGRSLFVTVFFNILDDLKASVPLVNLSSLPFFGKKVGDALEIWKLSKKVVAPLIDRGSEVKVSLWTLKLYPGAESMTESLRLALDMICSLQEGCIPQDGLLSCSLMFFSLADAAALKDVTTMLNFRRQLFDQIQQSRARCST